MNTTRIILYVLLTISMSANLISFYRLTFKPWRARTKGWWENKKDDWAMRVAKKAELGETFYIRRDQEKKALAADVLKGHGTLATKKHNQEESMSSAISRQRQELMVNAKKIEELEKYKIAFDITNGLNKRIDLGPRVFRHVINELVRDPASFLDNHPNLMKDVNADFIRNVVEEEDVKVETDAEADLEKEQKHQVVDKKISKAARLINKSAEIKPFIPEEEINDLSEEETK